MPFPELEPYKHRSREIDELLAHLELYLNEVLARPVESTQPLDHAAFDLLPALVAKAVNVDVGLALVGLQIFEEAGVITHRYDVYCPHFEERINSFSSKHNLPTSIHCPYEGKTEHGIDEYFVEVVFNFSPRFVRRHLLAMSM